MEAAIEAILFTMGNSVELTQIADAIQQDRETTRKILRNMMDRYQQEDRGIQIIELEQSYQMCSKKEYYECLIRLAMHPKKPALTDVMLETLSIIAYKQPVTKAEIEKIRGVKCDHAINKLVGIRTGQRTRTTGCTGTPDSFRHHRRVFTLLRCTGTGRPAFCRPCTSGRFQGRSRRGDSASSGCLNLHKQHYKTEKPVKKKG